MYEVMFTSAQYVGSHITQDLLGNLVTDMQINFFEKYYLGNLFLDIKTCLVMKISYSFLPSLVKGLYFSE